jgi:dTDP-4-dehydrorhamnose reductase
MKKILLLGANGQLGTDLQEVFRGDERAQLIPVTRSQLDVERVGEIAGVLDTFGEFDILINCTSYHKTDEVEDFPEKAFAINSMAVWEMAKHCQRHGRVLFHISTDYVFGGQTNAPYREEDATAPLNVYGISKVAGENFIRSYHDKYFIFRVSSLFGQAGASGKGGNFVETMIRLAKEGKPLRVVDDQIMSPTHTLDIARAIKTFITQDVDQYGTYHCSGEGQCSWYEFTREIFAQLQLDADLAPISHNEFKTKARRPAFSVLDNSKINRIHQMPEWKVMLHEYLKRKNHLTSSQNEKL